MRVSIINGAVLGTARMDMTGERPTRRDRRHRRLRHRPLTNVRVLAEPDTHIAVVVAADRIVRHDT
jgi:hypothetical protein